jgi:hypothetical protein
LFSSYFLTSNKNKTISIMGLSNLTQYTQENFQNLRISPFSLPPQETTDGDPNNDISVELSGFVSGTNQIAFIVRNSVDVSCSIDLDPTATNQVDANVGVIGGPNPSTVTYWTVDVGLSPTANWTISYSTNSGGRSTGKWVFTKGKTGTDEF